MIISKKSKEKVFHEETCVYVKRMNKKYRQFIHSDQALARGYRECSWCCGLHGAYVKMQHDPIIYGEKPRKNMTESWDRIDKALCFRTDCGFWKVLNNKGDGMYRLWHLNQNHFESNLTDKELMRRVFHRQKDVSETKNIGNLIRYIAEHDKAKKIIEKDWKQLPKKTPKQKKYFKQAQKREQKKQRERIDKLFEKLEKGEL